MAEKSRIFIDNCAWDVLHRHGIDLAQELPASEFQLLVTKEVGAFEMPTIPATKQELLDYVQLQMKEAGVKQHSYFGFASYAKPKDYRYRIGGFNEGVYASHLELKLLQRFKVDEGKERKTGLYKNEADASLAVRACAGNIVITAEKPDNGPLKEAAEESGNVVSLLSFDPTASSLKEFILNTVKAQQPIPVS